MSRAMESDFLPEHDPESIQELLGIEHALVHFLHNLYVNHAFSPAVFVCIYPFSRTWLACYTGSHEETVGIINL